MKKILMIIFTTIFMGMSLLAGGCGDSQPKQLTPAEQLEKDKGAIIYTVQQYVKQNLKDPDSADFKQDDTAQLENYNGKNLALVIGSVRATNSFNAHLLQKYVVVVDRDAQKIIEYGLGNQMLVDTKEGQDFMQHIINKHKQQ
jgi:hypothetical protein